MVSRQIISTAANVSAILPLKRRPTVTDLQDSVVRAIVHLNFQEPEQALEVLLVALSHSNFVSRKENADGNAIAAA